MSIALQQSSPVVYSHKGSGMLFGYLVLLCIATVGMLGWVNISFEVQFWGLTSTVFTHNIVEIISLYRAKLERFYLQPVVLGSVILFMLQFGGITNFLMIDSRGQFSTLYNHNLIQDPEWLPYAMSLILASSVMYWIGYRLSWGRKLFNAYHSLYARFLESSIGDLGMIGGWLIGCAIKLKLNQLGAIGHKYIVLVLNKGDLPALASRLKVFEDLSLLFLVMMLFTVYQQKRRGLLFWVVIVATLFELLFAITSGARGTLVFLFLAFFMVDYFFRKKLKIIWVFLFAIVLVTAMTLVSKYKDYVFQVNARELTRTNPIESIQLAIKFNEAKILTKAQKKAIRETARINNVSRFNYVNETAQMIRYKTMYGMDADDPDFLAPFFTFPIFAILPRYYLFGVPEPGYGYWATQYLSGDKKTSTAISAIGFSYLAGGIPFVLMIFVLLGVLMKAAGQFLGNIKTIIGFVLFIIIMKYLVMFDTQVYGTFIGMIRFGLVLPPLLWLMTRK